MAIIVADLVARLRAEDAGVEQTLDRTRSNLQSVERQAQSTGRTTSQMASATAAAYSRSQAASTRLRIAEDQLAEAKRTGATNTQQLMALEARVQSARASAISATSRYQQVQHSAARVTNTMNTANRQAATSHTAAADASASHTRNLSNLQIVASKARLALQTVTAAAGATATLKFFTDAVQNARRLAAQTNQLNVIFGDSRIQIEAWGRAAADTMRMSQREAQGAAVQFATFGKAAGLTGENLAAFSMKTTKLAADLASFQGVTVEEAILAMGSAFAGETETMRKYGVLLDENTLKEAAYAHGLAATGTQLTQQQKVAAVYYSMMEQLDYAQGDVERSNGKFGASVKTLKARFEEFSATIGQKVMPIAQTFIDLLSGPGISGAGEGIGILASTVGVLASAFNSLPGPLKAALAAIVAVRVAQTLLQNRMAQGPGVISRFGTAYSTALGYVRQANPGISTAGAHMRTLASGVTGATGAMGMMRSAGRGLMATLGGPWGLAIAGATAILGFWIAKKQEDKAKSQEAKAATEEWSEALIESKGAINSSIRAMAAKKIAETDALETAEKLGISQRELIDVILQGRGAVDEWYAALVKSGRIKEGAFGGTIGDIQRLASEYDNGRMKAEQIAKATGDVRVSFDGTAQSTGAMTEAMTEFQESTDGAASKVDKLAKALNQLTADGQTEEEAQQAWADNIRELSEALTEAGTAAVNANGKIDFTTKAGSELQDAVQKQAEAFNQVASAAFTAAQAQGKSVPEAAEIARQKLIEQRKALIDMLAAQGMGIDTANRLADAYGLIPSDVVTRLNVQGFDDANAGIGTLLVQLNSLPREKPVSVTAPGGQAAVDLLNSLGIKVRADNKKNIEVTSPMAPAVLDLLNRLGLSVVTNNGKTIIVTDNGTAAVVQSNIDAIHGRQIRVSVIYVDKAGNEVRGIDPSTGGVPLKPEYFKELAPKGKATGGPIVGPGTGTSDDVPLWGSNGEFMMKAAAVRRYGLPFMHAVNAQRLATGGPVGPAPSGGGDQAAVADPGTATVAVPGMGLPAALGQVADTVTAVKDSQLDPAMTEATAGVTEYGLATREQTAAVQAAWTATGSAVTTAAGTVIGPAVRGVGQVAQSTVAGMVVPALAGMRSNVAVTAAGVQTAAAGQINPAIASVGSTVQGVHAGTVDPVLAAMRGAVGNTAASFGTGAAAIASQWNSVREATAAPVRFTIGTVFNNGLVGMWNSVADLIGTSKMNPYPLAFASGGVMPGYTPGRDVHHFASPTGGNLALSGGEAIMRPEWTRAVGGPRAVDRMNALARSGGLRRVKGTDQYLGGDMAFASGGTVQGGAEITSDIQRTMWDAVRTAFPNVVLTSGTRYADVGSGFDNHMGQRALDLGGPMPEIARWIYQLNRTQPVEELIHAPLQGWQNLKSGQPLNYGADTDADHYDHVHWAMAAMRSFAGRLVSMAGGGGGAPAMQKSMATVIEETLTPLRAQVEKSMGGSVFGGQMGQVPRGVFAKMNEAMTARLRDLATKYMGPAIGSGGGDVERWRPMVIAALRRNGFEPNRRNQDLMLAQIQSESGGNPGIVQGVQDVNSGGNEAVGLLQVIPGTFEANRDPSLPNDRTDPWANMNAALRYYRRQYGDDLGSMWGKGHGYAQGGTIPGTGNRDTVPILATPGEEVIRKGPAEKNRPMLKKINEGGDVRVFVTNWPRGVDYTATSPAVPTDPTATPSVDPALMGTDPAIDPAAAVPPSDQTAAENIVAAAKRKHTEAVNKQRLAEMKLAEVQGNPKSKASQREAAEQAVAKAKNDVIAATEKQRLAEQKLDETLSSATGVPATPGSPGTSGTTGAPAEPPTAFALKLRNPFQPFWWRGEKEYQERIIQRARELEQAEQERYGAGSGTGDTTTLSSMLGTENAVAERKRLLDEAEGKLRIAQMKLDEVQGSKNPKPSQIEKARQDITRAENDVTKAKEDLAVAEQKLAENQAKPIKQPAITKMWVGGTVPGTGMSDTVPALLTPGEEVTRRAMAIKHRRLLKAINADKVARYASGGTAGFGGYSADDSDYMKPTSLTDWLALGVGGASSVASMVAPYAQMVLSGQVDLGNALPQLNTGANDPSGGFATSVVSDFASQISQQLNELIRAVKEGQDVHVTVQNDQSPSAAGLVGMSMGV